jgi:hypothetical protein
MAQWRFDHEKLRIRRPNEPEQGIEPPFDFQGVSMRVFPLRANMNTLGHFCNAYLNVIPPEVGEFRPAYPIVFLIVLDYGKMSVEAQNLGWISQREVTFSVPLEWHRREASGDRFVDWTYVSPFIFVDNAMSLATGREVYGWPKVLCSLSERQDRKILDPRGWQRLISLSTASLTGAPGHRQGHEPLLEIDFDQPAGPGTFPPDPRNSFNPLMSIPNSLLAYRSLFQDALEAWFPTVYRGYQPRSPRSLVDMTAKFLRGLWPASGRPYWDIVTLKQFPDADEPELACYQALVKSRMTLNRFNRGGYFGDFKLLQGDPSGGVRVRLHRDRASSIVEALGLETTKEVEVGGAAVSTLIPVFPFWLEMDMGYGRGQTVCWRTRDSAWYEGLMRSSPLPPRQGHLESRYNTVGSGTLRALAGTIEFRDASLNVFPLLADRDVLDRFVRSYLNFDEAENRFEAWGSFVYLVVGRFDWISSEKSSLGPQEANEVGFYVPVKRTRPKEGESAASWGLVCPFAYGDNSLMALLNRELLGQPFSESVVKTPPGPWMQMGSYEGPVLEVRTGVFPALGVGVGAEERTILEIGKGTVKGEARRLWSEAKKAEEDRAGRATPAMDRETVSGRLDEIFSKESHTTPVPLFSLKQIRDADEPSRACFQAIVRTDYLFDQFLGFRELDGEGLHVRIHRYPSQPVVDLLGLRVKLFEREPGLPSYASEGAEVAVLEPSRPCCLRVAMRRTSGKEISLQTNFLFQTQRPESAARSFGVPGIDRPAEVGEEEPVEIHPQDVLQYLFRWIADRSA